MISVQNLVHRRMYYIINIFYKYLLWRPCLSGNFIKNYYFFGLLCKKRPFYISSYTWFLKINITLASWNLFNPNYPGCCAKRMHTFLTGLYWYKNLWLKSAKIAHCSYTYKDSCKRTIFVKQVHFHIYFR